MRYCTGLYHRRQQTPAMETTQLSLALLLAFAASVCCFPAEVTDPCAENPCHEGGTCYPLTSKDVHYHCNCTGTKCDCKDFFFKCEYPDPCKENHCQNGGTCYTGYHPDEWNYFCGCQQEYYGEHCEFRNNFCDSNPCQYGGVCWVWGREAKCYCSPTGITGRFCEENGCASQPCQNDGFCYPTGKKFTCFCGVDYMGETCQWKRN